MVISCFQEMIAFKALLASKKINQKKTGPVARGGGTGS
jgi:hypothetical protein